MLLLVAILAYGILIPWLGFYWDDWPKAWFLHELGPSGLHSVYAEDRPNLAWTYLITTSVLGETPIPWQVFGVLARWLTAVAVWWMLKQVWQRRTTIAVVVSLVLLVFPGFGQQYISLIYSHFLLIQAAHLFALGFMVLAIRQPRRRLFWTGLSIAGSVYSLFSIEYYVGWELLRPLLIYWVVGENDEEFWPRVKRTMRFWLPYMPILPLYIIWRTQVIGFPTYSPSLLNKILEQPLLASIEQVGEQLVHDLIEVAIGSWMRIIPLPTMQSFGALSTGLFAAVTILVLAVVGLYLYRREGEERASPAQISGDLGAVMVTGVWAVLIAGWPFWITELPLKPYFPNDRFMLSFMLGGSLIAVALVMGLGQTLRTRVVWLAIIAVLVGLGAGQQFRYATEFRRERDAQSNLLWQFIWRVPDLERGTTILVNELPFKFDDDESLTAAINWIYGDKEMPYLVADLKVRLGRSLKSLEEGQPIHKNYRATTFDGTTSQVIVMSFDPPKCVRVYDVVLHDSLPGIPDLLPSAIPLSNRELILTDSTREVHIPRIVLGPEPPHRWCYFFEKADLAHQAGAWEEIAELGDAAFGLGYRPNDASERLPFIEGYAHVGRWDDAAKFSLDIFDEQPQMAITVCRTWIRLEQAAEGGKGRVEAFAQIFNSLPCDELRSESGDLYAARPALAKMGRRFSSHSRLP